MTSLKIVGSTGLLGLWLSASFVQAGDDTHFESKIRPVLAQTCFRCHDGEKTAGGLRVDSREVLLLGGDSGPAIMPGMPERSLFLQAIPPPSRASRAGRLLATLSDANDRRWSAATRQG